MSTLDVYNPYDLSLIKTVDLHNAEQAQAMLDKAVALFNDREAWLTIPERVAILKKLIVLMEEQVDDLAMQIAQEGGKPLKDAQAEAARAINGVEKAIEELGNLKGREIPMNMNAASMNKMAYTFREPAGVVIAVSAFNHPLNLIVHQVIPAVATGCPVIVKPARATPLSCLKLVELLEEAGLPEGWAQVCVCDGATATELVTSDKISFFSFIGSAKVGWMLKSKLAPGVHCALEHGGVAPVIVDKSADVESMLPKLAKGGFYHAGQVCVSVQRVYVHESMVEDIAEKLADEAAKLIVGPATSASTDVGPLIEPSEVERVHDWVMKAEAGGAKVLCGGRVLSPTCYAPTVLLNPSDEALVSTEEVFGPVVCVYSYKDLDEAVERANSLSVNFQAAVFSKDLKISMDLVKRLKATAVMVNDHTAFRVDWMPFGGREGSGYGMGGIVNTMEDLMPEKLMVLNLG